MSQPLPPTLPPASATPTDPADAPAPPPARPLSLSVVVPYYNQLAGLLRLLRSLVATATDLGQMGRLEILVQDDASSNGDLKDIVGAPVAVARNERNLGFAGNCNAGAARAQGDVLLFLNQDTRARAGWWAPLLAAFDNLAVGVVGPKLVFGENPHGVQEESVQSCGGLFDAGKGPFHRWLGWAADDWRVNVPERVSWTTGAALAVRRELFAKVGGFDEGYVRGYFEDVDLSMKVRAAGAEVWYEPRAVFEHQVGSTGGVAPHIFKANSLRFHAKWDAVIVPDTNVVHVNY